LRLLNLLLLLLTSWLLQVAVVVPQVAAVLEVIEN